MSSSNILLYIFIGFLLVNLFLGLWAGRGVKTVEEYAIGKKKWSTGGDDLFGKTIIGGCSVFRESEGYKTIGIMVFISYCGISISQIIRTFILSNQITRFSDCFSFGDFINKL